MTTQHPEINQENLSNLRCYLAPKKNWIYTMFDTKYFQICANSCASSFATRDKIYFIPGTYNYLNGVTINGIAGGIKVAGYVSVSWILQYDKKENIEIIIEQVLHIPGLTIWLIFPQQV